MQNTKICAENGFTMEYSGTKLGEERYFQYKMGDEVIKKEILPTIHQNSSLNYTEEEIRFFDNMVLYCEQDKTAIVLNARPLSLEVLTKRIRNSANTKPYVKLDI